MKHLKLEMSKNGAFQRLYQRARILLYILTLFLIDQKLCYLPLRSVRKGRRKSKECLERSECDKCSQLCLLSSCKESTEHYRILPSNEQLILQYYER